MAAVTAGVFDSSEEARQVMRFVLERTGVATVVCEAGSVAEASGMIFEHMPEVVFLDTAFPDGSGFDLARLLRPYSARVVPVFVASSGEGALEAFDVGAADYILKPVDVERLMRSVTTAQIRLLAERLSRERTIAHMVGRAGDPRWSRPSRRLVLTPLGDDGHRNIVLDQDSVVAVEAAERGALVTTTTQRVAVVETIGNVEALLEGGQFFRSHRSCLINIEQVTEIVASSRTYLLKLRTMPELLPLSRRKFDSLRGLLNQG